MTFDCSSLRSRILVALGEGVEVRVPTGALDIVRTAEVGTHLGECEDCGEFVTELGLRDSAPRRRAAALLAASAPRMAPDELAGRVVAALHAGYCQDRAVEEVNRLPRLSAPAAMERRLERSMQSTGGLQGLFRRSRRAAPRELEARLDTELRGHLRATHRLVWVGMAAAAVLLLVAPWRGAPQAQTYSFTVRELSRADLADWEPLALELVSEVSGGLFEARPQ